MKKEANALRRRLIISNAPAYTFALKNKANEVLTLLRRDSENDRTECYFLLMLLC